MLSIGIVACASAPHETTRPPAPSASVAAVVPSSIDPEVAARIDAAARDPDEEALVRLGDALGARILISVTRDPARRKTALAALPYAVDCEVAFRDLAQLAFEGRGDDELVLETIARLTEIRRFDEIVEPEGIVEAHAVLRRLSTDEARTAEVKALAETAYRRLEEYARGRIDLAGAPPKR